jgi:SAM-dependent methyltransferase
VPRPRKIGVRATLLGKVRQMDDMERANRARSFDGVAAVYDATRPGYPDALFDELIAAADLAARDRVLEIGCGAGQATIGFAARGFPVLALDPGPALLDLARRKLAPFPLVEFRQTSFEAWPVETGRFKLVAAAQSWHWIPPEQSFPKSADALMPGGVLAVFGHVPVGINPAPLHIAAEAAYRRHVDGIGKSLIPAEFWYLPNGPVPALFAASGCFDVVTHRRYPWVQQLDATGFAAQERTRSYVQTMAAERREALISALEEAVSAAGGRIEIAHETHCYWARRLDRAT